ncbi:YtxH domain-containing protein [Alistipes sp. Z76]|nr:YtxH domain-containing protein [Alistipes sp. Z76]NCE67124.1 YtxH domain-containing protein [Muribaculaceae bacterium M3]
MKNNGICSLISFLGGALVGSVVTMLVTPQSGPDLRRRISNYVEREADKIRCQCDDDK